MNDAEFPSNREGEKTREPWERRRRDDGGAKREEREPGKALGCNFSRYIRDGSRNEPGKEQTRGKRAQNGREKVACEFPAIAAMTSLMAANRIIRAGFFSLRNLPVVPISSCDSSYSNVSVK